METLDKYFEAKAIGNAEYRKDRRNALKEMGKRDKKAMDYFINELWKRIGDNYLVSITVKNKKGLRDSFIADSPIAIQTMDVEPFIEIYGGTREVGNLIDKASKLSDVSDMNHILTMEIDDLLEQGYTADDFNNYPHGDL
jgi:hypothetical protein